MLIFGGSQGARVMAEVVPAAVATVDAAVRARLAIVQQAREEDVARVSEFYVRLGVPAEVRPFFSDLPARMAAAHLVIARSGAGTVAELAAVGRPAILVPLPHALDQDQLANATVLERAGAAIVLTQDVFTPETLAAELASLAADPARLAAMAAAAKATGATDAAERLADLVMEAAGLAEREA
jgi:UDP-N-acetylglucosamine--N-acetylmuramyl-(pentapeptide) pyrophosphoryl-undecaprenol N-acetylglucosamine transferase